MVNLSKEETDRLNYLVSFIKYAVIENPEQLQYLIEHLLENYKQRANPNKFEIENMLSNINLQYKELDAISRRILNELKES